MHCVAEVEHFKMSGDMEPEFRFDFLFDGKFGCHYYKIRQSYGTTVRHGFFVVIVYI